MKTLRTFCAAVALTLTLAASAAAGTIHTGVASPPPPPPASTTESQTGSEYTDGTIHTGVAEPEPEADTVTGIALDLLRSVLSLF